MKQSITKLIKKSLKKYDIKVDEEEIEKYLEIPPKPELGDYAFPCFFLAEKLNLPPHEIAIKLREKIQNYPETEFEDIQVAGPYINFFFNRKSMARSLILEVLREKNKFGSTNLGKGKKAIIEHTSINPNAAPHVGRARNALIGDSIVRILSFLGFKPEVHYYVNDVSKQIAMLVLANAQNSSFKDMLKKYIEISKKIKKSKELEDEVFGILFRFEHENKETVKQFKKITKTCVEGQREILKNMGIEYEVFDYESDYINKSKRFIKELGKTKKLFKDKEGRLILDQKDTSLKNMMKSAVLVLTRSDGTGLYPLRDIAYTSDKIKRAKENIIVLGEDQKLYFKQLSEALKLLGYIPPKVVHYSFILLTSKGKSKKMSTRKGNLVLLEEFLGEAIKKAEKEIKKRKTRGDSKKVGIGAVKYSILKNNNNKIINFNLDESLNFDGNTGPYLQYSYARASSIIKKSKKKDFTKFVIPELQDKELELVKLMSNFKNIVLKVFNNLNPSMIANYAYNLAKIFNEFYHTSLVLGSHEEFFRLALVESFRVVLKNALSLIGIETMEEM